MSITPLTYQHCRHLHRRPEVDPLVVVLGHWPVSELEVPYLILEVPGALNAVPDSPQRLLDILHLGIAAVVSPLDPLDVAELIHLLFVIALNDYLEIDDLGMESRHRVVEADLVVARGIDGFAVSVVGFTKFLNEGNTVRSKNSGEKNNFTARTFDTQRRKNLTWSWSPTHSAVRRLWPDTRPPGFDRPWPPRRSTPRLRPALRRSFRARGCRASARRERRRRPTGRGGGSTDASRPKGWGWRWWPLHSATCQDGMCDIGDGACRSGRPRRRFARCRIVDKAAVWKKAGKASKLRERAKEVATPAAVVAWLWSLLRTQKPEPDCVLSSLQSKNLSSPCFLFRNLNSEEELLWFTT